MKPKIPEVAAFDRTTDAPDLGDAPDQGDGHPEDLSPTSPAPEVSPVESDTAESKTRRFFRKFIRWTAGILIVFGLGFLTGIFLLYRPAAQEAERNSELMTIELTDADTQVAGLENQIADLETQITSLQPYKDLNDELVAEQQALNLHIAILDARVDVANALLALSEGNPAQVRVVLAKTTETLDTINSLLDSAHQEVVSSLKERLELVLTEVDDDPFAAQSDLDVLGTKLLQLQDSLFSK
jgi:hypothetical protein